MLGEYPLLGISAGTIGAAVNALRCVSLSVNAGEYAVIFGPSGSGKTTLMSVMAGLQHPTEGEIVIDEISIYRELEIGSPLMESGLTKLEIRELSRQMNLPTWDKASFACLSSRFQYGDEITLKKLKRVEQAEDLLKEMGFRVFRARDHSSIVRLEVGSEEIQRLFGAELRSVIVKGLKKIGYSFVSLDLEGYRTGSMNDVINIDKT